MTIILWSTLFWLSFPKLSWQKDEVYLLVGDEAEVVVRKSGKKTLWVIPFHEIPDTDDEALILSPYSLTSAAYVYQS